jgi:hypothetical protein
MYAPEALPIPAPKPPSSVHKYQGGLNRVHGTKRLGRPPMSDAKIEQIKRALISGRGIRATARETAASTTSVMRVARSITVEQDCPEMVAV